MTLRVDVQLLDCIAQYTHVRLLNRKRDTVSVICLALCSTLPTLIHWRKKRLLRTNPYMWMNVPVNTLQRMIKKLRLSLKPKFWHQWTKFLTLLHLLILRYWSKGNIRSNLRNREALSSFIYLDTGHSPSDKRLQIHQFSDIYAKPRLFFRPGRIK